MIMYVKHDIEEMLKEYLLKKSQLEELERKIESNNTQINFHGTKFKESEEETIRNLSLSSPEISDIPKGKTNKINNTTENIALTYREKMIYTNKADKIKLMNENVAYNKTAEPLRELVGRVERMLRALNNEEKLIIKTYYMYEPKWNYVVNTYFATYKETRTINQLKNIRDTALEKMLKVVNI